MASQGQAQGSSPANRGLAEWMTAFTGCPWEPALKQWPQGQLLDVISERTQMGQKRGGCPQQSMQDDLEQTADNWHSALWGHQKDGGLS